MLDNLSIVIPYYNGIETIDRLLLSIPKIIRVTVVDDCSEVPLVLDEGNFGIEVIRLNKKGYFSGSCNAGFQACRTDVLILNQDTWFDNDEWLNIIEENRGQYAMIGERIKGDHPTFGSLGYSHGTFCYFSRAALDSVGLLSDLYPLWGATAEWQLRAARKGFQVLPLAEIPGFHHARPKNENFGSSIKEVLKKEPEKQELFLRTPPLLSVIVPTYNYGYLLQDCINSLIGGPTSLGMAEPQSLQSFEIIVVNDASTDDSAETIDKLAKIEQGIRAYHLPKNVGTAKALNYGIQRAVGKYITFLSADDMREPFSLEALVKSCEDNPHSFAYDDVWLFYKHQRIKQWKMEEYDFEQLLFKNQIHAGIVFPKRAWEEVGGYPGVMHDGREDWAFNVALGLKGWCGIHVKQFGYLYRREGQNRTETNTSAYHLDYFRDKLRGLFPKVYGGYRPMACCGRGSNATRSNVAAKSGNALASQNGAARMASNVVGATGMVRLEYTGRKMASIWAGHTTNVEYVFGADKPRGWVDRRDVGERGKSGFLNSKDGSGNWIFRPVADSTPAVVTEEETVTVVKHAAVGMSEMIGQTTEPQIAVSVPTAVSTGALSVAEKPKLDFPDPTDLTAVEIKALNLTREQWVEVYRTELSLRNRKGVISWLEEKLAEDV